MAEGTAARRKPGRPPGTGPVARLRRELLTDGKVEKLITKTYEMALAGDLGALRLLLDRSVPVLRSQSARVKFGLPNGSITEQAKALLEAGVSGALPPDTAAELITALANVAKITDIDDLRRRLDALEYGDLV